MPKAPKACAECRARKLKCDLAHPSCSNCRRSRKSCNYQAAGRTPLTRRYLTKLENELAEARAIIQERNQHDQNQTPTYSNLEGHVESRLNSQSTPRGSHARPLTAQRQALPLTSAQTGMPKPSNSTSPPRRREHAHRCALLPPELGPQSTAFEWDERRNGMITSTLSNPSRTTHNSARGGYFGVTSTQEFLRISGRQDDIYPFPPPMTSPITHPCPTLLSLLADHVDAYFARCHPIYPVIHEPTFRAQMTELVDRPCDNVWQMLLYAVAALGAFSASTREGYNDLALFEVARSKFSNEMMETGNMSLVQALTLMAVYLRKRYKLNSSYNYLGLANRVALGIGLYKEFSSSAGAPFYRETRRRLWWCLYTLNLEDSIAYSRPYDFPQIAMEVGYPLNIDDLDLNPNTSDVTAEANTTTLYSHLKFGASFYFTISKIYPSIISGPYPRAKELLQFDDCHIQSWELSLPSFLWKDAIQPPKFTFPHALLYWRCLNFRLLIYRPFIVWLYIMRPRANPPKDPRDPVSVNTAIARCLKAAEDTITAISEFWESREKDAITGWYVLHFIFPAVLVVAMCLRYDPASIQAASWRDQARRAMGVIESLVSLNSSASHCLDMTRSLLHESYGLENQHTSLARQFTDPCSVQIPALDDFFTVTDIFLDSPFWEQFNALAEH